MKISHFPDFWPDETVFSVASRYLDRMQFCSHSIVSQHFFGRTAKGIATDLPSKLEHLIQVLPPNHMYTADKIIDQHTLFPLYAPFLSNERALTLRQRMKTNGTAIHAIAGIATSKVSRLQWLRYCPVCVDYDRLTYGECYWHRLHQVPWISVCPIHEVMLEDSSVNLLVGNDVAQFRSAECEVDNLPIRMVPANFRRALVQLARNVNWLLDHTVSLEQGYIHRQYFELLAEHGLVTATGRVRYAKLKEAVSDYYPPHVLEDFGCDVAQENWLAHLTRMQHPLRHLLFIQFLCETAQEFFTKPKISSAPFGKGPWPCLNPLCSYYKERVITSYTIHQGRLDEPVATFACLCGFVYSRTGPDRDDGAIFRIGRILQYGAVWDKHLIASWSDQNISTFQVARLMHSNVQTIRRQAARLGLSFAPDIPRRGNRPRIYLDYIEEQRDFYRALWEEELEAHSNVRNTEAIKPPNKAYSWLNRHDRGWLIKHCPATHASSGNEQLLLRKMQLQRHSYLQVDADLTKIVRKFAEEIYTRSDFPVQITRKLLIAQICDSALLKRSIIAFNLLPLTSDALAQAVETSTAFIWRKLRWTVQNYLDEQVVPPYCTFLSRAHISFTTSTRPIIRQLIQIAYYHLSTGMLLSDQMPAVRAEVEKSVGSRDENVDVVTNGSLAAICIDKQLISPDKVTRQTRKVYDLVPILLLTVAAVVNGAETCSAIVSWGYQNEELLRWLGLPEGQFPAYIVLKKIYAKLNIDIFESVLGTWLHETFPQVQNETNEMTMHSRGIYVPGIWLLRPFQHIASTVVARLR